MRTLELPLALVAMVTSSDPDIKSLLSDCLQIKVPVLSLEQSRLNSDPTTAVILDRVRVTLGVGPGNGVGVGVGVRVAVETTVSNRVSEATTSASVDVATKSSITEVAVIVVSVLAGMMEGSIIGVVEISVGAAVEETEAGVDTATVVVDTAAHIIVKSFLSNNLLQISKHTTLDKASVKRFLKRYASEVRSLIS